MSSGLGPGIGPSEAYLLARLEQIRERTRALVEVRQAGDPDPDNRFRGLYITDEQAQRLLEEQRPQATLTDELRGELEALDAWAHAQEGDGVRIRLRSVAEQFELSPLDVEILLVTLGPDLDPRLERAYGYLHDDVTRRRASVGLALELCSTDPFDASARRRLAPTGPLVAGHLVAVEELERPFLTRSLRVPDPVAAYLLGQDTIDPSVAPFLTETVVSDDLPIEPLVRAWAEDIDLVYVRDRVGAAALSFAATAVAANDRPVLALDLGVLAADDDVSQVASAAVRHARMSGATLVVGPIDKLAERGHHAMRLFTDAHASVVLIGSMSWDPTWSRVPPLMLDAPDIVGGGLAEDLPFRLTPEQVERALHAARRAAIAGGGDQHAPTIEHLAEGARAQNAGGLERLALRIAPNASWDDLVLPPEVGGQLHEIVDRVRQRDRVLTEWGLKRGATKGTGVTALFAGDSGTGKTLAAEVLAAALTLDLYVIDLATVVDKYIGETEKNLDRIFNEADRVNGVLLFDEADAIFGKRSEVQDARDRYANVEVAYLLQRMERFDGVAILTTNLRANIDDAFLRRLDALVDFPVPDEDMRRLIWERHLPERLPRNDDVDVAFLAKAFDLAGGNIRNIALSAAFLAASAGGDLKMEHLVRATAREYRKMGRLCVESEFAPYFHLVS